MGSSYDACYPAVTALARAGVAATMVDTAELLHFRLPMLGPDDDLILVSQSGESAETVRVAEVLREAATDRTWSPSRTTTAAPSLGPPTSRSGPSRARRRDRAR